MMRRVRTPTAVAAVLFVGGCAGSPDSVDEPVPLEAAGPILGTMECDVVALIDRGEDTPGALEYEATHANFTYRFTGPENRDAFVADPARYEIQLGGGCGRMGALSGTGSTDLRAVHDGKLYIFASEGCRTGFLATPERFLEPLHDPPIGTKLIPAARALELLASATAWIGGAERLDGVELDWVKQKDVEWDGSMHSTLERRQVGPWPRYRVETRYDEDTWVKEFEGDIGFLLDPETGLRPMQFSQLRSIERRAQSHVLFVLQARSDPEAILTIEDSNEPGVEVVHVWLSGFSHRIGVRPDTGEILWHAYRGVGPDQVFGERRDDFTRWESFDGLRIPFGWTRTFDGQPEDPVDRAADGWKLTVRRPD